MIVLYFGYGPETWNNCSVTLSLERHLVLQFAVSLAKDRSVKHLQYRRPQPN